MVKPEGLGRHRQDRGVGHRDQRHPALEAGQHRFAAKAPLRRHHCPQLSGLQRPFTRRQQIRSLAEATSTQARKV